MPSIILFLDEGRIVVRGSHASERSFPWTGKEHGVLSADTLMICDGVKPVAIGGVMGGLNSEVKAETETILLESAYFNPASHPSDRARGLWGPTPPSVSRGGLIRRGGPGA